MKFCPRLFHEINFEPDAIQPCCDVQKIKVPRFPFSGGTLDIQAYAQFIQDVLTKIQSGALCAGCHELREEPVPPQSIALSLASVTLNQHRYRCNCRCVYCGLWQGKHRQEDIYPVLPAIRGLVEHGAILKPDAWFHWGGGEPVILREFPEVCRYLLAHGRTQYVHTSALRHSPDIDKALGQGKCYVNVSLDSGTPETYAKVKGLKGWDKALESLGRYMRASLSPLQVCVKYIIFDLNNTIPEITKFFSVCEALGSPAVSYSFDFREVNKNAVSEKSILAAAYFTAQARRRKLTNHAFFIPPLLQERINSMVREHFSR